MPRPTFPSLASAVRLVCWLGLLARVAWATTGLPAIASFDEEQLKTRLVGWITLQDREGTLYFGCNSLLTFDGERWKEFPIPQSYGIRGLDLDAEGRLWAGGTSEVGWFSREPDGGWMFHSLRSRLPPDCQELGELWHTFVTPQGVVFVTVDRVLRWNGTAFEVWSLPGDRRLRATRIGGKVYVHHIDVGVQELTREGLRMVVPASVLGRVPVMWMEATAEGWLFLGSEGLFRVEHGRKIPCAPAASAYLRRGNPTGAVRLADGRLALANFEAGILLLRPDLEIDAVLTTSEGLPTRAIYSLFEDREGALWVTSGSHIFRVALNSASTLWDVRRGLRDQPIQAVARHEGSLLALTDDGVLALQRNQSAFSSVELLGRTARNLRATPRGLLLSRHRQLALMSGGVVVGLHSSVSDIYTAIPSATDPETFLAADYRSVVRVSAGATPSVLASDSPAVAYSLAEDNCGRIWMGSYRQGAFVILPGSGRAEQAAASWGLPEAAGETHVVATTEGAILVQCAQGAWVLAPGAERFQRVAGSPARTPAAVTAPDATGNCWVVYPGEGLQAPLVARILLTGGQASWTPHAVEDLERIGVPRALFAEPGPDGGTVLWIGGSRSLLQHRVGTGPRAPLPAAPRLTATVASADGRVSPLPTGDLPYATAAMAFEFSVPEFARRPLLRIESRVDGLDEAWVRAGPDSRRVLNGLRDGDYVLRVRTVAETGMVSPEVRRPFVISPPWWRTAPVAAGVLLGLFGTGVGLFRLRIRALQRRNRELEARILARTAELTVANAAKTQFLAHMSHDIRNPLNGIAGLTLALQDSELNPRQRSLVAMLRECTAYLATLVDDVLDFASIEAGRIEVRAAPFEPAKVVNSVVTMLSAEAEGGGALLLAVIGPEVPPVLVGDAGRIQQVLMNYVTNSIRHSGGYITVSVRVVPDAPGEVEFGVDDEGAPIPEEEQARLFTKFTRLPGAQRKGVRGSGLGLASCRLVADAMGGAVGVRNHAGGGGKRFFLRLPLDAGREEARAALAELPPLRVLLVEDMDYNAIASAAVLERLGLAYARARNGAEALELFARSGFQLVLLDRNLPDMDGTEVARKLRALEPPGARTLILAVTAYCTTEDRDACLQAGMDAFVGKPLTPEKLRAVCSGVARQLLSANSVQVAQPGPGTPVDLTHLRRMGAPGQDGWEQARERYLAELTRLESGVAAARRGGDREELFRMAHALVAHAALVSHRELNAAARALQAEAREAGPERLTELGGRVARAAETLRAALAAGVRAG